MKKIIVLLLIIFSFTSAYSGEAVFTSGTVTTANMKLSIVNGTAFVDFSSAGTLTPYAGMRVEIIDSASKVLTGYIKAAGTGETFGANNVTFGNMETESDWAGYQIEGADTQARSNEKAHAGTYSRKISVDGASEGSWNFSGTLNSDGGLFIFTGWSLYPAGATTGAIKIRWYENGTMTTLPIHYYDDGPDTWKQATPKYRTTSAGTENYYYLVNDDASGTVAYFDDVSLVQVLTPSTTGVTITSAKYGATYNWTSEESGFNRNDASGYTYNIYKSSGGLMAPFTKFNVFAPHRRLH